MSVSGAQEATGDGDSSNSKCTSKSKEKKKGKEEECEGRSLFVGSFNINAEDLTMAAAKAWLKHAEDADIVALGLQECGTVPVKPFPKPTNGMAKARWKRVRGKDSSSSLHIVSEGTEESGNPLGHVSRGVASGPGETKASEGSHGSFGEKRDKKTSMTEIVEAFKSSMNTNHSKKNSSTSTDSQAAQEDRTRDAEQDSDRPELVADYDDTDTEGSASSGGGSVKRETMTMRRESYYLRGVADENREKQMLQNLAECLPGRKIVADVAMGETPTGGKRKVLLSPTMCTDPSSGGPAQWPNGDGAGVGVDPLEGCGNAQSSWSSSVSGAMGSVPLSTSKTLSQGRNESLIQTKIQSESFTTVEWYGTIRLLVFVREEAYRDLTVKTVVIPSGDKPSCVPDAPQDYPKDTSPDKGAVACYLVDPSAQLEVLLVNCHLFGTNKYGVGEAVFDKLRMAQLRAIDAAIGASLPDTAPARMVLLGDLNFRIEVLDDEKDKARGGNDFQAVLQVAEVGDVESLLDLYKKSDRLRLVLDRLHGDDGDDGDDTPVHGQVVEGAPEGLPLLSRLEDGLGSALLRGKAVRPTFTFKPGDTSDPRRYNDKRTPSWTDRILWRGFEEQEHVSPKSHYFTAVRDVISSDHEPVYCLLTL